MGTNGNGATLNINCYPSGHQLGNLDVKLRKQVLVQARLVKKLTPDAQMRQHPTACHAKIDIIKTISLKY